jgi:vacuolar-type H+-ATPase subunit F/Vma7
MKTRIQSLFLLPAVILGFSLAGTDQVAAQTFTNLHNFAGTPSDGKNSYAGVVFVREQVIRDHG